MKGRLAMGEGDKVLDLSQKEGAAGEIITLVAWIRA